jgi:hypothetical protein
VKLVSFKMSSNSKKQGTRVFKKGSPNGKITVYLGKRDFVDHVTHVDPIDGVVLVDPEYLKVRGMGQKEFVGPIIPQCKLWGQREFVDLEYLPQCK